MANFANNEAKYYNLYIESIKIENLEALILNNADVMNKYMIENKIETQQFNLLLNDFRKSDLDDVQELLKDVSKLKKIINVSKKLEEIIF
jgi:hypothetical protein